MEQYGYNGTTAYTQVSPVPIQPTYVQPVHSVQPVYTGQIAQPVTTYHEPVKPLSVEPVVHNVNHIPATTVETESSLIRPSNTQYVKPESIGYVPVSDVEVKNYSSVITTHKEEAPKQVTYVNTVENKPIYLKPTSIAPSTSTYQQTN